MAFQIVPLLIQLAISVTLSAAAYLLGPKVKGPKPEQVQSMEAPTAEAGRPIPVVFGEKEVTINVLWFGQNETKGRKVKA